jgi:non-ribosomal peptide synthetase component F
MQTNILEYLDQSVLRVPDKLAFGGVTEADGFTFAQVNDVSQSIGSALLARGLRKEPVVVFMDRHPSAVVAFLGVLQAGCYYVPIDQEMPRIRIDLILENLHPRAIICDETTIEVAKTFTFDGELLMFKDLSASRINEVALA